VAQQRRRRTLPLKSVAAETHVNIMLSVCVCDDLLYVQCWMLFQLLLRILMMDSPVFIDIALHGSLKNVNKMKQKKVPAIMTKMNHSRNFDVVAAAAAVVCVSP